jgi:hypothetical protein
MEDTEQALAEAQSQDESADATLSASRKKPRSVNRGALPSHLPREEIVIEPEDKACQCCGSAMHVMGEDRSERLDVIPAQFKVIVTRRPKYACRACEEAVVQAPAPARLIEGGIMPITVRSIARHRFTPARALSLTARRSPTGSAGRLRFSRRSRPGCSRS